MKSLLIALAAGAALASGLAQAQAVPIVAKMKEGKGHPKSAASEAELKAAVEQVLATI